MDQIIEKLINYDCPQQQKVKVLLNLEDGYSVDLSINRLISSNSFLVEECQCSPYINGYKSKKNKMGLNKLVEYLEKLVGGLTDQTELEFRWTFKIPYESELNLSEYRKSLTEFCHLQMDSISFPLERLQLRIQLSF